MKKYKVKVYITREVEAEDKEEAEDNAYNAILEGNGYYVHDYLSTEYVKEIE